MQSFTLGPCPLTDETNVKSCTGVSTTVNDDIVIVNVNGSWLLEKQHYQLQTVLTTSVAGTSPIVNYYSISEYSVNTKYILLLLY